MKSLTYSESKTAVTELKMHRLHHYTSDILVLSFSCFNSNKIPICFIQFRAVRFWASAYKKHLLAYEAAKCTFKKQTRKPFETSVADSQYLFYSWMTQKPNPRWRDARLGCAAVPLLWCWCFRESPHTTDFLCTWYLWAWTSRGAGVEGHELTQLNDSLLIHIRVRVSLGLHSYSMLLNLLPNWQCSRL